jgi:hypothetical protein
MKHLFSLSAVLLLCISTYSQSPEYPYDIPQYDFINYNLNKIIFPGDSTIFMNFMANYSGLIRNGEGQLSIVHIGGSHLQADIYSHRIRERFQTFIQGNNGGRGLIFPYSVARTNNPSNYKVSYTGRWESCRNVEKKKSCSLGLSGISVTTYDTLSSITITFPEDNAISYDFNRVRIFYLDDNLSYDCSIHTSVSGKRVGKQNGMETWDFHTYADSLVLNFSKTDSLQERFTLFGISLGTDDPGMIYQAVGVNGAKIPSFLRCSLLPEHMAYLEPDMVVLSLGTNDAYTRYFNKETYRQNYDTLIRRIRTAVPGVAVLLTVPNDSYLYRRYANKNTEQMKEVILELAAEHECGVWDFYSIMGGLNSIWVWQRFGLAKRDRIHFTQKGYELKGDLFFNAFLKSYDNFIDQENKN